MDIPFHSIKNLYLDDKAMHNLALTSSTPLDLPMVCEPRSPGFEHNKFIYGPYVTDDANQYCDPFHSILRSKHDLMKMPEGQEILSDCVNYLNRQKLVIHEEVLDFLISEWESGRSDTLFKEYIKPMPSDNGNDAIKHNAIHYRYQSILSLASNFRKLPYFYLPVFGDFRGRLYTFCSLLSYQGQDLSRGLIGFYNESEEINSEGLCYVYHYMANTFGNDKLSHDNKVSFSESIIKECLDLYENDKEKWKNLWLNKAAEPVLFLSLF
uniref:DNA-directed RNA polymerase n=1 Tax=Microbotryum lychnidis-dioicae TaxID=288795 RepID=M1GLW4_9BASI|nr:hypothetical protein H911_mgp26 [Microbotryum lychnidis-dioicae]YP_007475390.1 hypothetical protein H911_mgp14 [Microbotryum lychnidis-dioicae]AGE14592.1 hypothetical protein [Microbotryum lychnidis-dioicae]AGE14604.1 hypothetical protein [Microbotryum lychnidis-dioicae]